MKADSPACVLKKKYHMTYGICEEAVYHVYCKTRLSSRSNFIVFRIFKIGFQLGSTFDPVLFDGTVWWVHHAAAVSAQHGTRAAGTAAAAVATTTFRC